MKILFDIEDDDLVSYKDTDRSPDVEDEAAFPSIWEDDELPF